MRLLALLLAVATLNVHALGVKITNQGNGPWGGSWVHVHKGQQCGGTDLGGIGSPDIPVGGSRTVEFTAVNVGDLINARWQNLNGTWQCGSYTVVVNGQTPELRIWPGLPNDPGGAPSLWHISKCVTNTSGVLQDYRVKVNGVVAQDHIALPPGTTYCFDFTGDAKASIVIEAVDKAFTQDGDLYRTDTRTVASASDSDAGWWQDGSPPKDPTGSDDDGHVDKERNSKDNLNIDFNLGEDLAKDETVRTGFSSLYGLEQQALNDINNSIRAQANRQSSIENAINQGWANLNGTMTSVASGIGVANNYLNGIAANTAGTKTGVDGVNVRLDTANVHLSYLENGVGSLNNNILNLGPKLDSIDGKIGLSNTKLGNIDDNTGRTKTGVDDVNSKLNTANAFLGGIEGKLGDIRNHTQGLVQRADTLNDKAQQIKDAVDGVKQALQNEQPPAVLTNIHNELVKHTDLLQVGTNLLARTLEKITALTNNPPDQTPASLPLPAQLQGTMEQIQGVTAGVAGNLTNTLNDVKDAWAGAMDAAGHPAVVENASYWQVNLLGQTYDLNPLHIPLVNVAMTWLRQLLTWIMTFIYVYMCWLIAEDLMQKGIQSTFAGMPKLNVGGAANAITGFLGPFKAVFNGLSLAGKLGMVPFLLVLAVPVAGFMTLLVGLIPAFFVAWNNGLSGTNFFAILRSSPWQSAHPVVTNAIWLMDQVLPLDVFFAYLFSYIGFRLTAGMIYIGIASFVLLLIGLLG